MISVLSIIGYIWLSWGTGIESDSPANRVAYHLHTVQSIGTVLELTYSKTEMRANRPIALGYESIIYDLQQAQLIKAMGLEAPPVFGCQADDAGLNDPLIGAANLSKAELSEISNLDTVEPTIELSGYALESTASGYALVSMECKHDLPHSLVRSVIPELQFPELPPVVVTGLSYDPARHVLPIRIVTVPYPTKTSAEFRLAMLDTHDLTVHVVFESDSLFPVAYQEGLLFGMNMKSHSLEIQSVNSIEAGLAIPQVQFTAMPNDPIKYVEMDEDGLLVFTEERLYKVMEGCKPLLLFDTQQQSRE